MILLEPSQVRDVTMTSAERIRGLHHALTEVHKNKIEGDFVECGVWRGGNVIIAKTFFDSVNDQRTHWAYDTFEGMTAPSEGDPMRAHQSWNHPMVKCLSPLEEVLNNFKKFNINDDTIRIVKGDVTKTLLDTNNLPEKISILRLDTDWYASTLVELEVLYHRLVPGGYIIVDDYGHWEGCKKAVDEFFGEEFVADNFTKLDDTGIMYKKL
jgi:O-methyltransferase